MKKGADIRGALKDLQDHVSEVCDTMTRDGTSCAECILVDKGCNLVQTLVMGNLVKRGF
jgi:hypothetical protein